jgi:hypothetical protein
VSQYVALHKLNLKKQTLKPVSHRIHWKSSRVETGRFQAMGQLDSTCTAAPPVSDVRGPHAVALQVAFERQTLKPVFHLIGYRLWV